MLSNLFPSRLGGREVKRGDFGQLDTLVGGGLIQRAEDRKGGGSHVYLVVLLKGFD